jgi:hypothetical protein
LYRADNDPLAFDVMPALSSEYGRAPYLRAPGWFFKAIGNEGDGGSNHNINDLQEIRDKVLLNAPSVDHAEAAINALTDLENQTRAEGIRHVAFVNTDEPADSHRGIIEHEVVHTAQRAGLVPAAEWLRNHPLIGRVLSRRVNPKMGMYSPTVAERTFDQFLDKNDPDRLLRAAAMEMMTYWVQGRSDLLKMTDQEGEQFFRDYINHLRSEYGQEAIDQFTSIARLNPRVLQVIHDSNVAWGEWMGSIQPDMSS